MRKACIAFAAIALLAGSALAAPEGGSGSSPEARPDLDRRNTGPSGQGGSDRGYRIKPGSVKGAGGYSNGKQGGYQSCAGCN